MHALNVADDVLDGDGLVMMHTTPIISLSKRHGTSYRLNSKMVAARMDDNMPTCYSLLADNTTEQYAICLAGPRQGAESVFGSGSIPGALPQQLQSLWIFCV